MFCIFFSFCLYDNSIYLNDNLICFCVQIQGIYLIVTGLFEIYALSLAVPGSAHYGYYLFSFDFVYVGNPHGKLLAPIQEKKNSSELFNSELHTIPLK